jgi:hypothetical protein
MARAATFLVVGASAAAREQAIAALLANPSAVVSSAAPGPGDTTSPEFSAVILEGLGVAATPLETGPGLQVVRIAPGCLCCDGNLVLRVTLNRLLRQRPGRLFLGLASSEHLDQLRSWLAAPPYDQLLALNPTVHA